MNEKKLTNNQKERIEEIKREWFEELEKLPDNKLNPGSLSNRSNHERRELEKKYWPKIQAIYEE